ncbi:general odorant-binding protein 66 [Drosophila tropicalis]|uniref:general odorant-binding protein 66 n=1 Tax=Drosophila tropicalis TaxID=46794 RepID=UPI0035ABE848
MYLKLNHFCLLLMPVLILGSSFNYTNCDQAKQPKFLSSCCHVQWHDKTSNSCRESLLREKGQLDKVELHACMAECLFKIRGYFLSNGSVNVEAMQRNYQQQYKNDSTMSQLISHSLNICTDYARKRSEQFQWMSSKGQCDYLPATLMACIMEQVYENCPASRWKISDDCQAMRKYLLACDDVKS